VKKDATHVNRTDARTDALHYGQPENMMPLPQLSVVGGGIKTTETDINRTNDNFIKINDTKHKMLHFLVVKECKIQNARNCRHSLISTSGTLVSVLGIDLVRMAARYRWKIRQKTISSSRPDSKHRQLYSSKLISS